MFKKVNGVKHLVKEGVYSINLNYKSSHIFRTEGVLGWFSLNFQFSRQESRCELNEAGRPSQAGEVSIFLLPYSPFHTCDLINPH